MSKLSEKELNRKYATVWLIKKNKRFLLNYFFNFSTACDYCRDLEHFKIDGELSISVMSLKKILELAEEV